MKIGILTNSLDKKTGGGRYANDLIGGLQARGHVVVILKEFEDGLPGFAVLERGWRLLFCIRKVRVLLSGCDVIHALDGYPSGVIAALANRTLRKRLVITGQGTYAIAPLYHLNTALLTRYAYRVADRVITISHFTKSEIEKKVPNLKNIIVIHPGIDLRAFLQVHDTVGNNKYVVSVGALKTRKGYNTSISAYAEVVRKIPDLEYHIVGNSDSTDRAELEALAERKHLGGRIHFHRNIPHDELLRLYRGALLFVLTPINENHHVEGFGLVYLEAAASGLPVIGTSGNGGEDAIWPGHNGLLVPQCDSGATARAIIDILSHHELWQQMSTESINWAKKHSIDDVISRYEEVYKTIQVQNALHP